jgi:membrane fusion protein (multidrug efflux system)
MSNAAVLDEDTDTANGADEDSSIRAGTSGAGAKARPRTRTWLVATVGALSVAGAAGWYVAHRGLESTDDAQIDADVVSIPSRTSAAIAKIYFTENQHVKAGDLLAELDAAPAQARLAQAEANLAAAIASADVADADAHVEATNARANKSAAQASLSGAASAATATHDQIAEAEAQVASAQAHFEQAHSDLDRAQRLADSGAIAKASLEQETTAFTAANASLAQAKAHLGSLRTSTTQAVSRVDEANAKVRQTTDVDVFITQAEARARAAHAQVATLQAARDLAALEVSYTRIVAPEDGYVSKKTIEVGQMVSPSQPIVQLVPEHTWVTGNFKETQLATMKAGQRARVSVDAYPGVTLDGEVESFSAATGARFSLLPPDNASGNYTKIVQRVPVRIHVQHAPGNVVLRPGMSVELTVDTRS